MQKTMQLLLEGSQCSMEAGEECECGGNALRNLGEVVLGRSKANPLLGRNKFAQSEFN
jgi:hypothetical protein